MKDKFKFLSLSKAGGSAQFNMMLPFGGAPFSLDAATRAAILGQIKAAAAGESVQAEESLAAAPTARGEQLSTPFESLEDLLPKEDDYVRPVFRALSQTLVECYCLDYSRPGVLEASVPLLQGQTVYPDHCFYRVAGYLGVISKSFWDGAGADSDGVPGINVELKIDWRKEPWIARGLMMKPPAIHSFSVTVFFEFEFSHPDLVEEGRFWSLLGEEVGGQIVRLIVTKILGYWEGSLVFQGADTLAKQLPTGDESEGEGDEELAARRRKKEMSAGAPAQTTRKEKKKVKVTAEQKQSLGLQSHEGEDIDDGIVLQAATSVAARAQAAEQLVGTRRAELLRVATLAECGSSEGTLPAPLRSIIEQSQPGQIEDLIGHYSQRAADKFPQTCQSCGSTQVQGRSSVEETGEINKPVNQPASRQQAPANSIF